GGKELGAGLSASHQLAPATFVNLDTEFLRSCSDTPPSRLPLAIADALDLVETGDCVADVTRVVQRLLAFFWKRKRLGPHSILLLCAQTRGLFRDTRPARPSALHRSRPLDVFPGRRLLLLCRHDQPPLPISYSRKYVSALLTFYVIAGRQVN